MKTRILLLGVLILGFTVNSNAQVRNTTPKKVVVVTKKTPAKHTPTKVIVKKKTVVYQPASVSSKMVRETLPHNKKSFHFKAR
jgi:hypothetical protein